MKNALLASVAIVCGLTFFNWTAGAQTGEPPVMSTPPVTLEEMNAMYNATVEDRTVRIMLTLALSDSAASNRVYDAICDHYHALRARDEAIDYELGNMPKGSTEWQTQRIAMFPGMSKPLHDRFIATLSKDLSAEQVATVKDKMTYGKVQFTYHAYCSILPNLTESDKAKVLDMLKQAREVAMDGGSSGEKTAIFQQYKDQINDYLKTQGFDVAQATREWTERQKLASNKSTSSPDNDGSSAK